MAKEKQPKFDKIYAQYGMFPIKKISKNLFKNTSGAILYADNKTGIIKHAIKIEVGGRLTSKNGHNLLIEVSNIKVLSGPCYGYPFRIYAKML
jgi:hypothetical protein